jgi:glycosyltransferase involved in cell wall biosynthesis
MVSESGTASGGRLEGKRIVIVFPSLKFGGAERQGLLLARHLRDVERAGVEVWALGGHGRTAELCEEYGIPWRLVAFQPRGSRTELARSLVRLALQLRKARPDVLLPYTMIPNVACGIVRKWTGARFCLWQQRDEGRDRMRPRLERWAVDALQAFVTNSSEGAHFLTKALRVPPGKIHFIRNGVVLAPPLDDRVTWRQRLGLGETASAACMVANVHSFKDHETLLKAWRIVLDRWPQGRALPVLLLAGRLDNTGLGTKVLAFDLDLCGSVRFLGAVKDIAGLLGAVDLGVFSSRFEGCPNGVLECMASGLAVAGTDIPGIRDAVGSEGQGFLAPAGDAEALAARITTLLDDAPLRSATGSANLARIQRAFSPALMCGETVKLIAAGLP